MHDLSVFIVDKTFGVSIVFVFGIIRRYTAHLLYDDMSWSALFGVHPQVGRGVDCALGNQTCQNRLCLRNGLAHLVADGFGNHAADMGSGEQVITLRQ